MNKRVNVFLLTFILSLCSCNENMSSSKSSSVSSINSTESSSESTSSEVSSSVSSTSSSDSSSSTIDSSSISSSESSSSSISSSSISLETINVNVGNEKEIDLNGYDWSIKENMAISNKLNVGVSSINLGDKFKTYFDGKQIEEKKDNKVSATFTYELDPEHPCSTDSVEHAQNELFLNGKSIGLLHNNMDLKTSFDTNQFKEGQNVVSLRIGFVYMYDSYHPTDLSYQQGKGDDFRMRNFAITLGNGKKMVPSKVVGWYCSSDFSKLVSQEMDVSSGDFYWIGDGWGARESYFSKIDHKEANYVRPVIVDYYFDYEPINSSANYEVDLSNVSDGKHTITCKVDDITVKQNNFIVDNSKPNIDINVKDGATITSKYSFDCNIKDDTSEIASATIKVDGTEIINNNYSELKLLEGNHNISVIATDIAGNTKAVSKSFNVSDNAASISIHTEGIKQIVDKEYDATYVFKEYQANKLNIIGDANNQKSSTEMVYDSFDVEVNDNSNVYVIYNGSTTENEKLLFTAKNKVTNDVEKLYVADNGTVKFRFDPTNYVENGKVRISVSPYKAGNGSNKMIWASDTQYLPKAESNYSDIRPYYNQLMTYVKDEYNKGNISYMVHTGDIVDDNPSYKENALKEWANAVKAFNILDSANVPYGTCAGNHDVGSSVEKLDYSYYASFFGVEKNGNQSYYGGSLNNNECHYDLITVGDYDFVILYLGYGKEVNDESIEFANKVLARYSHRNAIIATHAYLDNGGTLDPNARGQEIYDKIVVPNENVKLVLCGHTDGSEVVKKTIGNRVVFELLSCYQFVETTTDNLPISSTSHVTNNLKCNGEGFIKSLEFKDGKMIAKTFSPVLGLSKLNSNNGITYKQNDYTIKLDLTTKVNEINRNSVSAYQLGSQIKKLSTSSGKYSTTTGNIVVVEDASGAYGFNTY